VACFRDRESIIGNGLTCGYLLVRIGGMSWTRRVLHRVVVLGCTVAIGLLVTAGTASAGDSRGGVALMTAAGEYLTGTAAVREYDALREQPTVNCGSCRKYVVITAQKMPYIARNINMAFKAGKPFVLHKVNQTLAAANRAKACAGFQPSYQGSCDEYPFASSAEGGAGAQTQEVPLREQRCQGGTLRRQYAAQQIVDGSEYAVIIIDTAAIPAGPYRGTDIARAEGSTC
jgi:hypothetical protein